MGPFEYLLLFAAIILGLAVCDLALSLQPASHVFPP